MNKMKKQGFYSKLNELADNELLMTISLGNQLFADSINGYITRQF